MSKPAKAQTQLRTLRVELRHALADRLSLQQVVNTYRARATKAEQEAAEWKKRFDALLAHPAFQVGKL